MLMTTEETWIDPDFIHLNSTAISFLRHISPLFHVTYWVLYSDSLILRDDFGRT